MGIWLWSQCICRTHILQSVQNLKFYANWNKSLAPLITKKPMFYKMYLYIFKYVVLYRTRYETFRVYIAYITGPRCGWCRSFSSTPWWPPSCLSPPVSSVWGSENCVTPWPRTSPTSTTQGQIYNPQALEIIYFYHHKKYTPT